MTRSAEGEALDSRGFGRERCLALMASVPIGRVVYTDQALPAVTPVNFVLHGGHVTIRTAGPALAAAIRGAVVAFQTDDIDPVTLTGWSVTVVGRARLVEVPEETAGPQLRPWVHLTGGPYIRIAARDVSGCRLAPGHEPVRAEVRNRYGPISGGAP